MKIAIACDHGAVTLKEHLMEHLRKEGYEVKNRQFFRIGLPFTLVAVLVGYVYIWLIWA